MISEKQKKLDDIKWKIGQELGCDPCGTFVYCKYCNKKIQNPCENALSKYQNDLQKAKKKPQNKRKIGNTDFRATIVDER